MLNSFYSRNFKKKNKRN